MPKHRRNAIEENNRLEKYSEFSLFRILPLWLLSFGQDGATLDQPVE